MVHALEQIHSLLTPGSFLIDIHPSGELVEFILLLEEGEQFLGHMQETDDYIEYRQADEAIETVVSRGLFRIDELEEFEFLTHADSFNELKTFLDENWSDAVIPDDVIASAKAYEKEVGECKTILREKAIVRLLN